MAQTVADVPRVEYLRVRNYRSLSDFELKDITPLTVLLGPNGSGKSTVFDAFAFLSDCFKEGLPRARNNRLSLTEVKTRGGNGPIEFELRYREKPNTSSITYKLSVDEDFDGPFVLSEEMRWTASPGAGRPTPFLSLKNGKGWVLSVNDNKEQTGREEVSLEGRDLLGVSALGQFARLPRVVALRRFITDWYLSYVTSAAARGYPEAGPQERLSPSGDNLPNVLQFLQERHGDRLEEIFRTLQDRVPVLEKVLAEPTGDGRLALRLKDAPFPRPILSRFVSDGTLKMLAYLTVLYDPKPPQFVGIEEPENPLHPRLQPRLAEECRKAAARTQLFVTTHSPYFVDGVRGKELRILFRGPDGFTRSVRAHDLPNVRAAEGDTRLGELWLQGEFLVGGNQGSSRLFGRSV